MIIDEEALQKRQQEVMTARVVIDPDVPFSLVEIEEKELVALKEDAERLRFLRDEYVQEAPNWCTAAQSNADYFNKVIDNRRAMRNKNA